LITACYLKVSGLANPEAWFMGTGKVFGHGNLSLNFFKVKPVKTLRCIAQTKKNSKKDGITKN
jgi:hypothetical protein